MSLIFDQIPGIEVPLKSLGATLRKLWENDGSGDHPAPSEFLASQMNFILHLGRDTAPSEALARFNETVAFSRRYPCRMVVLCPWISEEDKIAARAKLYSECYIGAHQRDMRCFEAVVLGYSEEQIPSLKDQVTIWTHNDLPTYYRFHRIPKKILVRNYQPLIDISRRVIFDAASEEKSTGSLLGLANNGNLAYSRTLPFRQTVGKWLSNIPPHDLAKNLQKLKLEFAPAFRAEAEALAEWAVERLNDCLGKADIPLPLGTPWEVLIKENSSGNPPLKMALEYQNDAFIRVEADAFPGTLRIAHQEPKESQPICQTFQARLLDPVSALSESLFF